MIQTRPLVALAALAAAVALVAPTARADDANSRRPNVVIFLSDDMGWGQPGFQGGTAVATANLDRLAREGTSLTQFYVQAVCSPTRAALLTGRYPFRNGMEERSHGADVAGMLPDERTLAQALREAGYFTAILGKWHLGAWYKHHLPLARGFDHQYGFYGALLDSFNKDRGGIYDWHRNEQPLDEPGYTTFLIADEFERVLAQHAAGGRFFFYVPFNAVHGPHDAPAEYVKKYRGDRQLAMLECMDLAIGRMLDSLQRHGVLDETLLIFFNDNGGQRRQGNDPYRGHKGDTYEGGVRVACLLRWPGHVAAGAQVDEMLHVVDLYPTIVQLCGGSLEQPLPIDGRDAWPTITRGKPTPHESLVYSVPGWEASETGPPAIRVGDFKLVGDELFNIRQDPYEKQDLAGAYPEKVHQLKQRLEALAGQRRQPEPHGRAPGGRPVILGEDENREPVAEWLVKFAAERQPSNRRRRN